MAIERENLVLDLVEDSRQAMEAFPSHPPDILLARVPEHLDVLHACPDLPRFALFSDSCDLPEGVLVLGQEPTATEIAAVVFAARHAALMRENAGLRSEQDAARERTHLADVTQSIAHKNNNQLGILTGYMAILRDDPNLAPDARDRLQTMDHALQAMSRYNRGLTRLIKRLNPSPRNVPLAGLLTQTCERLAQQLDAPAPVELRLPEEPLTVLTEPYYLQTGLLALLQNAWESYSERMQERPITLEASVSEDEPGIFLVVADEGRGMPAEFREVAWDPFVTTKSDPEAGLGLAIARHLIRQIDGQLEMLSSPGRGTTVTIFLPAQQPSAVEQAVLANRSETKA